MPLNPIYATVAALHIYGLGSFPFARRYSGNLGWFLFLWLLRCFSSPGIAPLALFYSGKGSRGSPLLGSPIRISTDLCSLAAPRGISLLATSFVAYWRQGIHRTPLLSWPFLREFHLLLLKWNCSYSFSSFLCSFQRTLYLRLREEFLILNS